MSAVPITEHYLSEHAARRRELPGAGVPWLDGRRSAAMAQFAELGFPTPRNEEWKYTRVSVVDKTLFQTGTKACLGLDQDDIQRYLIPGLDAWRLVFVNGQFMPSLSSRRSELPEHIRIASLAKVLSEDPDALEAHLDRHANAGADGFAALNAAYMADGAYIHVPKGQVAEHPIHLLHIATVQEAPLFAQPRHLIVAEDSSQAQVLETYVSMGDSGYFTNAVTEVVLGANAQLTHYKVQRESEEAYHVATLQAHQARDSRLVTHSVSLGARLARNDINSVLDGEGAECEMNGLYLAQGRQHVDFHTRVDHAKPHGTSKEFFKGVLDGRSRGVFSGKVYVHPDAQKTDAAQRNANLLLSAHAEVDTKPQLEIYADDVKCSHGATVGQLDADSMFYLRSRGLDPQAARSLLIYAFANEVLSEIRLEPLRVSLEEELIGRLPESQDLNELVA